MILRLIIYPAFIGLGIYLFIIFSYPYKKVSEATGDKSKEIDSMMKVLKEMADDYREKLKNLKNREREIKERLFLSRLGENVTQVLHEIRNSTGAILGFGKLIDDKEIRNSILQETNRLKRFANHLLSLSGTIKLKKQNINLGELISKVVDRIDTGEIEIELNLKEEMHADLDSDLFSKAIDNIIQNALDACCEKGKIKIDLHKDRDRIYIIIKDTGKGMSRETRESMFDLFFTKKDGGVGVGMVLTRRIIEAHKGTINVKSTEGEGTTVTIILAT